MIDPAELLPVALEAAERATTRIRRQDPGTITAKGDRDMASEVDYAVEDDLRTFLAKETPEIGFLGEEHGGADAHTATAWILDPVDGTANYLRGLPLYAVSLALVEAGRPILGVVYLPALDQRYWATEGHGAYCDGKPITVSSTSRLQDAIVSIGDYAVGDGAEAKNRERFAVTEALAPRVQRIRMLGSAAIDLCWVAEGKLDACIFLSNHAWDVAAGVVVAHEAGAQTVDHQGASHGFDSESLIAATPRISRTIGQQVAFGTNRIHEARGSDDTGSHIQGPAFEITVDRDVHRACGS